ncbi:phosphoribosylanthranilate isomerase [Granulicella tundricola]|uniref:N-(5'-phosphoribosyl)anthranilate isomerase n=1 Tax=Granulicella tundricola (strain ATCC BAA-1859 / DSM 23138 / MP5ACTX9) TaxID=1198114 RepID=E8X4R4_GRATM|nr:phosphoribosylanthranilate isomerase [Granulicella tundricola]ADW70553.1 Phosphoribosylanthranilate isomerase [Granulicella tundricola MP5ACTX9]
MWIKICANTNLDDAQAAAALGADAVGFVFAPSKRQVTAAQVAVITPHLPPSVERVGVFSGTDVEAIASAAEQAGLTAIQLHGGIDLALAHSLQSRLGPKIAIIPTTHWTVGENQQTTEAKVAQDLAALAADPANYRLLIDAKVGKTSGGLGVSYDWTHARPILQAHPTIRVIVAGGLQPDTVAQAIKVLRPYGVDVASGVEEVPGKKSYAKLEAFIKAARGAS